MAQKKACDKSGLPGAAVLFFSLPFPPGSFRLDHSAKIA